MQICSFGLKCNAPFEPFLDWFNIMSGTHLTYGLRDAFRRVLVGHDESDQYTHDHQTGHAAVDAQHTKLLQ